MLVMLIGGGALFLVLGVALAIYCFSSGKGKDEDKGKEQAAGGTRDNSGPVNNNRLAPARPPEVKPQLVVLPPAMQQKVNQAIDKGVRYLKSAQNLDGKWDNYAEHEVGFAALPGLTLLECGVGAGDPVIKKAADFVRSRSPFLADTYDLALAILFLDRLGDPADEALIRTLALRLVAGQTPSGGWTYKCPVLAETDSTQLNKLLERSRPSAPLDPQDPRLEKIKPPVLDEMPPVVKNLTVAQDPDRLKPLAGQQDGSDNSNTQFAILGLWAARRHQVPLERTLALVVQRFRTTQRDDGSWVYQQPNHVVSSDPSTMTCAGLLGLAIGHGIGDVQKPGKDPAIDKGLKRMAQNIGAPTGRTENVPLVNLYFLWSVERVGMLYNLAKVDGKDWYTWAAEIVLANQRPEGLWTGSGYPGSGPTTDTCFALLVLKRANLAKDLTSKIKLFEE
jgi:hypothetical protein